MKQYLRNNRRYAVRIGNLEPAAIRHIQAEQDKAASPLSSGGPGKLACKCTGGSRRNRNVSKAVNPDNTPQMAGILTQIKHLLRGAQAE